MATEDLNVFIKNTSTTEKYALQVEKITVAIQKNPVQIAAPKMSPYLFDLGIYKPVITLVGVVDDQSGGGTVGVTLDSGSETYRIPTAYQMSRMSTDWWYDSGQSIYLYILNPDNGVNVSFFRYTSALQNLALDYMAASEERPTFSMTLACSRAKSYYPHFNEG
jgi:hypothetical protein